MITFLDENDVEYGALATIKATNAVNGERSLTGTIASGDYVLSNIERGWRLRFDDEYYVVTYAKPIDEGRDVQVEFDAVHQFFWDFDKSSVYDQLADGSHTFVAYLDFVFKNSGYSYTVDSALNVHAFEKQSFGFKKRLTLFNDIITSTGVEFQVNGKVVRILEKVGTDLSTVVRKNFNMNELTIEKNIGDFVTYQKGFGAYFDEEDHTKGRLEVEYTSPLASVYGKLEAEPFVDERYSQSSSLLAALKENVDNSYTISVSLDMEDLTRAGYKYKQPVAGDYIMAINETLDFQEKIRIVSFTSEYDVAGQLIKHTVTCNDIGSVKKLSASYNLTKKQAASASDTASNAYSIANKALVSADGKNTNYYGDSFPVDNPKGTLKTGDLLFLTVGDTVKQYYWNGADWVINPVIADVEAFKGQIAEELKDVPNREEFENKIAEELATSKAEITTQIESAKTQAESNAKEYADTINGETAKVAELANAAADEIKADLVNVKNNLTDTSLVANNAQAAVDAAKQELAEVNTKVDNTKAELTQTKQQLTTVADDLSQAKADLQTAVSEVDTKATNLQSDLSQAKQDLTNQAQQLQTQANAQSELTKRVSTVEKTADGTKTTVSELSKTVAQNGKDITSVTARTKVVEDDLAGTKTTLSQVQTTANSTSQKTATLETDLNGLTAKFNSMSVGGSNLFKGSRDFSGTNWINTSNDEYAEDYQGVKIFKKQAMWNGRSQYFEVKTGEEYVFSAYVKSSAETDRVGFHLTHYQKEPQAQGLVGIESADTLETVDFDLTDEYQRIAFKIKITNGGWMMPRFERFNTDAYLFFGGYKLERGNVATDYSPSEADVEQKVAEYKQNADQNYASLQTTVQNLDGTVQHNKAVADQTAQGFSTRIESLETYKDGESERANAYFESAKTETAKQLTAERTAIANNYVAKSTYTSDVTGIRNELSATTSTANATKTNLANYQASNDKMVASLKSSLQTTDGNVSNLQTKVEAVPGQITSAVSAVEGKIPTSIGGRNLWIQSKVYGGFVEETLPDNHVTGQKKCYRIQNGGELAFNIEPDFSSRLYKKVTFSAWVKYENVVQGTNDWNKFNVFKHEMVRRNSLTNETSGTDYPTLGSFTGTSDWKYITYTYDYAANKSYDQLKTRLIFNLEGTKSGTAWVTGIKVEVGSIPSDYSPAPEDTTEQISNLSSEIKQTADGITLLASKTELNNAKNELQSGITTATNKANSAQSTANNNAQTISTHTTQISALNTGLQAKVSQTDFNTLSGRVTTAENNITAKANELSSKITSVEGKIPTSSGGRNLAQGTSKDWSKPFTGFSGKENTTTYFYRVLTDGLSVGDTIKTRIVLKYTDIRPASGKTAEVKIQGPGNVTQWNKGAYPAGGGGRRSISGSGEIVFELTDKITAEHLKNDYWNMGIRTDWIASGSLQWRLAKAERGMFFTDWSPAPEDTIEEINAVSSELKQTKDGITLLASKTELNNAKNELQSGINTATNKANSNAQTISTHTNQISALNTGLQAKVSQTDFNTLSGRVTSAENNITAKANELTSKITSVEGKIPTSVGAVNLFKGSRDFNGTSWINNWNGAYAEDYQGVKIFKTQDMWNGRSQYFEVKTGEEYVFSAYVKSSAETDSVEFHLVHSSKQPMATGNLSFGSYSAQNILYIGLTDKYKRIAIKIKITKDGWIMPRFERNNSDAYLFFGGYKLERGNVATDYSPAPEDTATEISSLSSEFKQTTDAIKASVSSLDNSTVKSSSLTINADGIVMKAGKSTTDVANAIGSYFAVNQNAINLFSDKINVKGNMIVSGAITSDKIASKSINTAHLNGKIITADVIATNAITADAIKAGAVTTDKMSANSINGDRIAAGTLDAAKIKAGSITSSQIASGTITSNQIKAGGISSANIAAGAITGDKIAAGAIDANKIAANAITANMIRGGQLNSTNGATSFDLNAGTLTFNNDYGYIQRVASDKVFEITTVLGKDVNSQDFLTSDFTIRKSDFSRQAGAKFTLYNATTNKPTARATIHADELVLFDSQNTSLLSILAKGSLSNFNFQGWADIPVAQLPSCGLMVKDIGIGGYSKSLQKIVEELCRKTGVIWI